MKRHPTDTADKGHSPSRYLRSILPAMALGAAAIIAGPAAAADDAVAAESVPADAVTASGSGLDPDISPAYAQQQVARVAAARGLTVDAVAALVADQTQGRLLRFVGEPRVNVLELNLALSQLAP